MLIATFQLNEPNTFDESETNMLQLCYLQSMGIHTLTKTHKTTRILKSKYNSYKVFTPVKVLISDGPFASTYPQ